MVDGTPFGMVVFNAPAFIFTKFAQEAAHRVLNCSMKDRKTSYQNTMKLKVPGKPQNVSACEDDDEDKPIKVLKFGKLLSETFAMNQLCDLSWSGVPSRQRPLVWRLLCGYLPINKEKHQETLDRKRHDYWTLAEQFHPVSDEATYHQIHIDVPRMSPSNPVFHQKLVQQMLERILYIWAVRHPATGYVQGINDLVTPFLIVFIKETLRQQSLDGFSMEDLSVEQRRNMEADTFWCASSFLNGFQENYLYCQSGIQDKISQMQDLVQRVDKTLHEHLTKHHVDYLQFSFRWFNNLLTREVPLQCIIRLWDTYLAENSSFALFQIYICAAFLLQWREKLLKLKDFQSLMLFLQNLPTRNWTHSHINMLVAEAYRLKVMFADSPSHLK